MEPEELKLPSDLQLVVSRKAPEANWKLDSLLKNVERLKRESEFNQSRTSLNSGVQSELY